MHSTESQVSTRSPTEPPVRRTSPRAASRPSAGRTSCNASCRGLAAHSAAAACSRRPARRQPPPPAGRTSWRAASRVPLAAGQRAGSPRPRPCSTPWSRPESRWAWLRRRWAWRACAACRSRRRQTGARASPWTRSRARSGGRRVRRGRDVSSPCCSSGRCGGRVLGRVMLLFVVVVGCAAQAFMPAAAMKSISILCLENLFRAKLSEIVGLTRSRTLPSFCFLCLRKKILSQNKGAK